MAIFSRNTESAQAAVTKAEATVTDWEGKAAAARAEALRLDQESGQAILADESAAERIALNVQTWKLKANAYDRAAADTRLKLLRAQREVLEAEARDEDKEAAALRKKGEAHSAKVDGLKRQLQELDDCDWERAYIFDSVNGSIRGQHLGRAGQLDQDAELHAVRAAVIRYFLATGKIPHDYYEVNNVLGLSFRGFGRSIHDQDNIPQSVRDAQAAGLSFVE
ncbi:hypothetical protein HWD94_03835 [Pseudarthrobacter equi]|uniref:hypothetical protein n=1 Tax=Pseudarthrobacter equi TaxID=728066 RepID=UPI0021C2115A|nr:hypothetical protein [Pseudarthrobacter equi]MCT9624254.1 hypothetical protein [Pseudarthrobacter equi]